MTEKEKAKQLISKFRSFTYGAVESTRIENAKLCALIAVEELINAFDYDGTQLIQEYWRNVKKEIESL